MSYADEGTRPMTHLEEQQRAEIDRLRAELAEAGYCARQDRVRFDERNSWWLADRDRAEKAEARLAAVIALCDQAVPMALFGGGIYNGSVPVDDIRTAATGNTE